MKTWEMIKELQANPNKKFKSGDMECKIVDECIEFKRGIDNIYRVSMNRKWVEVKKTLTFNEVLELVHNQEFSYNVEFRLLGRYSVYEGSLDEILINLSKNITDYGVAKVLLNGEWFIC